MRKNIARCLWALVGGVAPGLVVIGCSSEAAPERTVVVRRGNVVRQAVAVGRIEVEHEVPVKSMSAGIVTKLFVRLGEAVARGAPLAEVRPITTESTFVQAERALELARDNEEAAKEFAAGAHLASWAMRLATGQRTLERMRRGAALARRQAEERLALLKEGKVVVDDRSLDSTVRAPVRGHILAIRAREGAPVVPSSSFGSGTVLVVMADLSRLLFRGRVDEIDVGRLRAGMTADIRVGALPGQVVRGKLMEIALVAGEVNNAMMFDVRIALETRPELTLRSGYSAVAKIDVARRDDVLVLPERVVEFRGEEAFVRVAQEGGSVERRIETGLSDGITVEITGLEEGTRVLERTYD